MDEPNPGEELLVTRDTLLDPRHADQHHAQLLNSNLKEELAAARKLPLAGTPIMKLKAKEPEPPKEPKSGKEKYSARKSEEDEERAAPGLTAEAAA